MKNLSIHLGHFFLRLLLKMHGTAIFSGHLSHLHPKDYPFAGQRQFNFSIVLRPWVLARSWESNPRPSALLSIALLTELIGGRIRKLKT